MRQEWNDIITDNQVSSTMQSLELDCDAQNFDDQEDEHYTVFLTAAFASH